MSLTGHTAVFFAATRSEETEVVLKFVSFPLAANNEKRTLSELNGCFHVIKMYNCIEFCESLTLFVLEFKQVESFIPQTIQQLGSFAVQVLEVCESKYI